MVMIVEYLDGYAEEVSAIFVSTFVGGGYSPASFAEELRPRAFTCRGTVLVAVGSGQVQGAVVLVPPSNPHKQIALDDEAELHLFAVAKSARGRGIGAALVSAAATQA